MGQSTRQLRQKRWVACFQWKENAIDDLWLKPRGNTAVKKILRILGKFEHRLYDNDNIIISIIWQNILANWWM